MRSPSSTVKKDGDSRGKEREKHLLAGDPVIAHQSAAENLGEGEKTCGL